MEELELTNGVTGNLYDCKSRMIVCCCGVVVNVQEKQSSHAVLLFLRASFIGVRAETRRPF